MPKSKKKAEESKELPRFKKGQELVWTIRKGKTQIVKVLTIVEADQTPKEALAKEKEKPRYMQTGHVHLDQSRDHLSYLVTIGGNVIYWPEAEHLSPIEPIEIKK